MPGVDTAQVLQEVATIHRELLQAEAASGLDLSRLHPNHRHSARNLIHYLALRRHDLRALQGKLAELGLSSLGRAESHVLANVEAVLWALCQLQGVAAPADIAGATFTGATKPQCLDFAAASRVLDANLVRLLGEANSGRDVRIMVTMPTEAASDVALVAEMLRNGMDCIRINCAHDTPAVWAAIIANVRQAGQALGRSCKVSMDLAGPKLRTAHIPPGPAVLKIKPKRDEWGRLVAPARLLLLPLAQGSLALRAKSAVVYASEQELAALQLDDVLTFKDCRGARRQLQVVGKAGSGWQLAGSKSAYLDGTTQLVPHRGKAKLAPFALQGIPQREGFISLRRGDQLLVSPAPDVYAGSTVVGCTLPGVLAQVKPGDDIWFDDGKIGGIVETVVAGNLAVRITHAAENGSKLRNDKGINLPSSALNLGALTDKDMADLEFVVRQADIVSLSFANNVADVRALCQLLQDLGRQDLPVVLKIETVAGFKHLPAMLLEAMTLPSCGVMIARGDLAIEAGFERLAELQEEILWLCEAAHVPVIWATQVLDSLARFGAPTRAEISDASLGQRADCVMLNKGPFIASAVKTLDGILRRMGGHEFKKQSRLRRLAIAEGFFRR